MVSKLVGEVPNPVMERSLDIDDVRHAHLAMFTSTPTHAPQPKSTELRRVGSRRHEEDFDD